MSEENRDEERRRIEDEDSYELDLDGDSGSIDDVLREAVEAVEKGRGSDGDPVEVEVVEDEADPPASGGGDDAETGRLREQLVRTLADFDNFRKRSEREKSDLRRFALFDALKDFLGVLDNLERAVAASGSADDLRMGVGMIVRQLEEVFRRYGVQPVEAAGAAFDPTMHEAVGRIESEDVRTPTVADVLQRGYRLHDRLLRPALVNVAVPAGGGAVGKGSGADDATDS